MSPSGSNRSTRIYALPYRIARKVMSQIVILSILSTAIGLLGLRIVMQLTHYLTKRPVPIEKLVVGLRPKLWMTAGLGIFFAAFYLSTIFLISKFLDEELRRDLFTLAYKHPAAFIYGGLALFASISLGILVVRSIIKRIYNTKR